VSKGSLADYVRFGIVDRNFKGDIVTKELQRKVGEGGPAALSMEWVCLRLVERTNERMSEW
jgi:hypothetical protein